MGLVATGRIPTSGGNGDWAFDAAGNLYVVGGGNGSNATNSVTLIDQQIPESGPAIQISGTRLLQFSTQGNPLNGAAFGSDGYFYLSSGARLYKVNPTNSQIVSSVPFSSSGTVDLASCASPSTVTLVKDFPEGRAASGDQVKLEITGDGVASGNTATTSGNQPGIQDADVGPVFALSGNRITLRESGAGASSSYKSEWSCVERNTGKVVDFGTGTEGSFVFPDGGNKGASVLCTFTNTVLTPSITMEKTADKTELVAGETVTYTFRVTNDGNTSLDDISINESEFTGAGQLSAAECPETTLSPDTSMDCTATYVVQQEDVDAGRVDNTATARGTPPGRAAVESQPSSAQLTSIPAPALSLVKSADKNDLVVGETIIYSFVVTNTGNVTLSDIAVTETEFSGAGEMSAVDCGSDPIAPGGQVICTGTYEVQQEDVDAGEITNAATAQGTPPGGGDPVTSSPDEARVPSEPAPAIELEKTADRTELVAGETVTYTFGVTNTGNVTLTDVGVTEGDFSGAGELSDVDCPSDTLRPGEKLECTGTYVVQQADVDAGSVENTATARGTPPSGDPVESEPSSARLTSEPAPSIALEKTSDRAELVAGETVTYTFRVTNTGNRSLSDVSVNEGDFSGAGEVSAIECPGGDLAPGDSVDCTATYVVQQADVDAGSVENTATATGTPPSGDPVTSDPSTVTLTSNQDPALELVKTASPVEFEVGDTITYTFRVTNTGNVTLYDVNVAEGDFSGAGELSVIECPDEKRTIAPGASVDCTATYAVQQADVDAGVIDNTATANGTPPTGDPVSSDPSSARVTSDSAPELSLVKAADKSDLVAGETITYSFVVTNTGNVTLTDVGVAETSFSGAGELSAVECPEDRTLAPGAQLTCTATYVVEQADVDAGSVENTATASGTPPSGDPVGSPPSEAQVPTDPAPAIELTKTADKSELVVGETVTYTFRVTNTGNMTLSDVGISEDTFTGAGDVSAVDCPAASLAPGEFMDCTATYVVQQADVDAGSVENTATATGTPPSGDSVTSDPSTATVTAEQAPAIELAKTADKTELVVGETVTYTFRVTNTGNVTLSDVGVAETSFSGAGDISAIDCPEASLAPGASVDCTAIYEVQQADVDAGSVSNTATATGTPPSGEPVISAPSTATLTSSPAPALELVKTASPEEFALGDTITYTFRVTNTGNVTLSDVNVVEGDFSGAGDLSALSCPDERTLAPGASVECTATYVAQQADVDAGAIDNSATATGTPPSGDPVESDPSTVRVTADADPALELVKSSDATELVAGETITYNFVVTNTGNVTLTDIGVTETSFSGAGELSAPTCPDDRTLAPGAQLVCTATYVVQQADVDAGQIDNAATAQGTPPNGDPIDSPPSEVRVPSDPAPAIELVKTADTAELVTGETVTYSFRVKNTGNVTLSEVSVSEDDFTGAGDLSATDCPAASLAPGEFMDCTATYVVQQADVDAGEVENTATAHGTPPAGGDPVDSDPSSVRLTAETAPAIALEKTADRSELIVGETVTYTFRVTNTGNVTLGDITVDEGDFSGAGTVSTIECPGGALAPGEFADCTATYEVQQADVDAGSVENSATATGTPPSGDPVTSDPSTVEIPSNPAPSIELAKTADKTELVVGETVTYTFRVTNTGNVTLSDIGITESDFSGAGELSAIECPGGALAPGESADCTATYEVQQADVDAGSLTNTATAHGAPPSGDPVSSDPSSVALTADPAPQLELAKAAEPAEFELGDTITYTFRVTNTGNVTLSDVGITEGGFSGSGELSAIECPGDRTLAPGASLDCTATYTVQQADMDAGAIDNTATAQGTPPAGGDPVASDPSSARVTGNVAPALELVKSADKSELVLGETITFSFVVTNTGNVTLTDVGVTEGDFSGAGEMSAVECPEDRTLAPGAQLVCTATYVVQQADVDAGQIDNAATAQGTPPNGDPIDSPPSEVRVPSDPAPAIDLVKTADTADLVAGETITFTFRVTNTGNVTLSNVTANEVEFTGVGELSELTCPDDRTLVPGQYLDCTATYVVQQADVDAGSVENTATATGTPPSGDPITSDPSTVKISTDPAPAIELTKTADRTELVVGETVTYTFAVTNTGNMTLTDVSVVEGEFTGAGDMSDVDCPAASLAPGEIMDCTATYVAQQADVDAGSVENTATATGTPPAGDPVTSDPSSVRLTAVANPSLSLVKSVDKNELVLGDTLTYRFVVTNTGNVTLTDVGVTESSFSGAGELSAVECPDDRTLAPGAQVTCTATYVVQQGDVDAGEISNAAIAHGTPPVGDPVDSPPSETQVPSDPAPSIAMVKSADTSELVVGETVTYTFRVTNTGNVSLNDVAITEVEFTGAGEMSAVSCPEGVLVPGEYKDCTATYLVQQADVDAGSITNTATASGTPPSGDPVTSDPSTVTVTGDQAPAITLVKSADKNELILGETVTYSFVATNSGNVTLSDVNIAELEFSGAGEMSELSCPQERTLIPGAQLVCSATYVVQQADVDAGEVQNTAVAYGTPPSGETIESDPSHVNVPSDAKPGLSLEKSADKSKVVLGETVTYTFVATNTGNVALSDVAVVEGDFSGAGQLSAVECPDERRLLPGEQLMCSATYVVQQADVDAGVLENTATATGVPPPGDPIDSPPSQVVIEGDQNPALSLVKTADKTVVRAGETITYSFAVTNTGDVTMRDVGISEVSFTGAGTMSIPTCPDTAANLAPGDTVICTATYVVLQADVGTPSLENTATAHGTPPQGDTVTSNPSSAQVTTEVDSLPATGGALLTGGISGAAGLAAMGVVLLLLNRRRQTVD